MRTNGTLQYQTLAPGGVDEYGEPIAAQLTWSDPIRCSIKTNTDDHKGVYEDGTFHVASYTILLEAQPSKKFERIRLQRRADVLGEYRVMSAECIETMGRFQVVV